MHVCIRIHSNVFLCLDPLVYVEYVCMLCDMNCMLSCSYAVENVLCLSIGLENTHVCLFVCVD